MSDEEKKAKERVSAVSKAVKEKKLRWKAGVTEISKMSEENRKNLLGAKLEEEEIESIRRRMEEKKKKGTGGSREGGPVDPPPEWDWRNVSGTDWTTPIKNQSIGGSCGSCVAFSVVAALEMLIKRWTFNNPSTHPDYSEAHLYFCNNRRCTPQEGNYGWWVNVALDVLKADGVSDESCMLYTAAPTQVCSLCPEWPYDIILTKIKDWKLVTDITEMKKVLSEHGAMPAVMAVYSDFFDYDGGVYEISWAPGVKYEGLHAITVVGYSDLDECWICKNSWGTNWGETKDFQPYIDYSTTPPTIKSGGWFRIAYGECGIDDGMYNIELICPAEQSADAMGFDKATIETVREFRDRLLVTRKGRAYLHRALLNIGDVTRALTILKRNKKIRGEAVRALEPFIKAVKTVDERKPIIFKEEHFKAAINVLDELAKADRKLNPAVSRIKQEIPLYMGKNIRQIMRELS
jgi:C1A family cysteine protease